MKTLDQYWYSQNPLAWLLLPLSWLFCSIALLRRFFYKRSLISSYRMSVPVIVVGNISVGGTGKTPLLIGLCEYLLQQGFKPGVVSRGYGASISGEHAVAATDSAAVCGDEPLLIHQRTACPVVIGSNRVAAANRLLAENDCDLVLSDDGLQHYRLQRDIEIAVVDSQRKFGNGFCLPAGPLREPRTRLRSVDMVVHHGRGNERYRFSLRAHEAVNLQSGERRKLASFAEQPVHALAGIGYPQRFFAQLRAHGLQPVEHAFPDHHAYTSGDIDFADELPILMTEKDAVKCRQLLPAAADSEDGNIWAVPVDTELSASLGSDLVDLIRQR